MRRWNWETHAYEPMTVPEEWNCPIYALNMDEVVNCPSCGKEMTFGEGYVSLEIHNALGFGYSVCAECYHEEWTRRREEGKGEG